MNGLSTEQETSNGGTPIPACHVLEGPKPARQSDRGNAVFAAFAVGLDTRVRHDTAESFGQCRQRRQEAKDRNGHLKLAGALQVLELLREELPQRAVSENCVAHSSLAPLVSASPWLLAAREKLRASRLEEPSEAGGGRRREGRRKERGGRGEWKEEGRQCQAVPSAPPPNPTLAALQTLPL